MSESKQHDAEETRQEQAARLVGKRINRLRAQTKAARDQFGRHGRYLSDAQRREAVAYLRRDFERTLGVLEDADRDLPEFSFVPDFADEI